jgi:hypothetical protein
MRPPHLFPIVLSVVLPLSAEACGTRCDRDCLVASMDQYLEAVVQNAPSLVPIAEDVVFVENSERLSVGEGLWARASGGPIDFRIYVADLGSARGAGCRTP